MAQNVAVSEVVALQDVPEHPQVIANDALDTFTHDALGTIRQPNPVARFDERRAGDMRQAPGLGQHSREVLTELGLEASVEDLLREGVLASSSDQPA
jgi:crotonobetainyl-CoA:carnitine CoA-transferase CaiB-like acyl-CoA transferase